jgi:hypothetical protein|tara:strand:+ start:71265 stop:71567 length:303 start_codon:yes stop_codon:yes gene_type:complete
VNLADHIDELKHENGAFHLAPACKAGRIPGVQVAVRYARRLQDGIIAETLDKKRCLVKGMAVVYGLQVHGSRPRRKFRYAKPLQATCHSRKYMKNGKNAQ